MHPNAATPGADNLLCRTRVGGRMPCPSAFNVVTASYRWRVLLVLTSLLLFAALYVLLVIGAGFLVYWSVVYPIGEETRGAVTLKIGLVGSSILLFLFLLKGLFKRSQEE